MNFRQRSSQLRTHVSARGGGFVGACWNWFQFNEVVMTKARMKCNGPLWRFRLRYSSATHSKLILKICKVWHPLPHKQLRKKRRKREAQKMSILLLNLTFFSMLKNWVTIPNAVGGWTMQVEWKTRIEYAGVHGFRKVHCEQVDGRKCGNPKRENRMTNSNCVMSSLNNWLIMLGGRPVGGAHSK